VTISGDCPPLLHLLLQRRKQGLGREFRKCARIFKNQFVKIREICGKGFTAYPSAS
jgi:hypothetical protein